MRALAAYIMRGQITAISAVTLCAVLSLLLMPLSWPLSYLSAAGVALVTLAQGPTEGAKTMVGASVLLALLGMVTTGEAGLAFGFILSLWLPAWLLAFVLYRSHSLAVALQALLVLSLGSILVIYAVVDDPAAWWTNYLVNDVFPVMEEAGITLERGPDFEQRLASTAGLITGILVMMTSWGMLAGLLIARWWQSVLYKPGAFGEEFRTLRLGRVVAAVSLVVFLLGLFGGPVTELAVNLAAVLFGVLLVQGLSVAHMAIAVKKAGHVWVVMLYALLVFTMPYLAIMLAMTGLLDNWMDFRKRIQAKA